MSEWPRRPGAVGCLDLATFDAALERAAERVLAAAADDDTAGARVVARVLAGPQAAHGRLLWVPAAAFALLVLAVAVPLREPAATRERPSAVGPVTAAAAVTARADDRSNAPDAGGASAPAAEPPLALVAAASGAAAPGARRRARARAVEPAAVDDASTVPLLEVTAVVRFDAADDAGGTALAPAPLPVDALALELLEPEALDPRRD